MRTAAFLLAAGLLFGAGAAWACPMQTAGKSQVVASGEKAPSTPIPAKEQDGRS